MKQILLYTPIFSSTAKEFVEKLITVSKDEDVEIYMNSPGGSVFAGWSIVGALNERKGKNIAKVFGDASSMALYTLLFMDEVYSLDVSSYTIHRADGLVTSPEDQKELDRINSDIRAKLTTKVNEDVFKQVTGKSFDELFDPKQRININLTAKEAKKIGLVNDIIRLEAKELKALSEKFVAFVDFSEQGSDGEVRGSTQQSINSNNNKNLKTMTLQEFKAQHPELHAEVFEAGKKDGVKAEQVRAKSWLAYLDIDKENVLASVKEGKEFTPDIMAEMAVKMASKNMAKTIEADSTEKVATTTVVPEVEKTAEQKKVDAEIEAVKANAKKITLW